MIIIIYKPTTGLLIQIISITDCLFESNLISVIVSKYL
jgi:hypothetical protein